MIGAEEHRADAGDDWREQQDEVGADVSEVGLDEHQEKACDCCEGWPDAAGDAVGALGAKGAGRRWR